MDTAAATHPRPWVEHYPEGITWDVKLNLTPVHEQVIAACAKNPNAVALDFLGLVLAKLTHDVISLRFILFGMVGTIGLVVHLTTLFIAHEIFNMPFAEAQGLGAFVAMTSNFILNNFLTYRDQRLKGFAILRGLLLFYLVCGVGLLANVGVAFAVFDQEPIWWLAGAAGALMGVVWNYAMSGLFVWRKR